MLAPLLPGATVCRDLIVRRRLGEGGWGEVWLVESEALGTQYALKRSLHSATESRDEMLAEIEAWMSLPPTAGIVPCYFWEIGPSGEILVLVQYVDGGTLGDQLRKSGNLSSTEKLIDVLIQVADALTALHDRDLIHGDLTPENILVAEDGSVGITDFGLTTSQNQATELTSGTVEYSGYEVASGSALTAWTDIWSWGLIAIELLVGERYWLSGCVALEIAAIAPNKLSEAQRSDPILVAVLDLAKRCFSPGSHPSAYDISEELRSIYRRLSGAEYARPLPVRNRVSQQPTPHSISSGPVSFDSPQEWWERATHTLGSAALPSRPRVLQQPKRRSAAIAAERIFRVLVDAHQQHLAANNYRDYLQLLEQLALAQDASLNHRAAAFTYCRLASQSRLLSRHSPDLRNFQAGATIQFANRRLVMGKPRTFLLRLYERAIRLREIEVFGRGDGDPNALLPTAYIAKAIACRYLGKTDDAIGLCNLAIANNHFDSPQAEPRKVEVAAYSFVTRSQCRQPSDPAKLADLTRGIELYQSLVDRGLEDYVESLATAKLQLIRSRQNGEPDVRSNLMELQSLEDVFWRLITHGDRNDLIEHFARVLIRTSRELCAADCDEEATKVAQRAVKWLEEAVIRQGRDDLRHELAVALSFLSRLLMHTRNSDSLAAAQIRRALRIWTHLDSRGRQDRYLPFLSEGHGLLAFVLAVGPAHSTEVKPQIARARAMAEQCGVEGQDNSQKRTLDLVDQAEAALHISQKE